MNNDDENMKDNQQQLKLHRRDTPHHLKNKRIINKNNDSATFDVKPFCFFLQNSFFYISLANYVT
jgi:hypothetical protein